MLRAGKTQSGQQGQSPAVGLSAFGLCEISPAPIAFIRTQAGKSCAC